MITSKKVLLNEAIDGDETRELRRRGSETVGVRNMRGSYKYRGRIGV